MKVVFAHGACVRDGAWWWNRMVEPLARLGLSTTAVDLPSSSGSGDLYGDSDVVRAVLDAADEPVILCGHSYGGRVIADAASHPAVERLVYIASVLPNGAPPSPWLEVADGSVGVNPELPAEELMFHDCRDVHEEAMKRVARTSLAALGQLPRGTVEVPSTYIVCAEDRWSSPELQRENAKTADTVVEIAAGHHPHLARPAALADLISS